MIAGTTYLLTNDRRDQIIGIGFDPAASLDGQYSATLKGGAPGVQAVDRRTMGGDYSWTFTIQPYEISLPLVGN